MMTSFGLFFVWGGGEGGLSFRVEGLSALHPDPKPVETNPKPPQALNPKPILTLNRPKP